MVTGTAPGRRHSELEGMMGGARVFLDVMAKAKVSAFARSQTQVIQPVA